MNIKKSYDNISKKVRLKILEILYNSKASHLGTSMSCVEILIAIYSSINCNKILRKDNDRCRVLISKGHAAAVTYATMHYFKIIKDNYIKSYHSDNSDLCGHVSHAVRYVEHSTGALGHGMPVAVGCAIGLKSKGFNKTISFAVCGDGELQEGSIWEALLLAGHMKLDNFCLLIDYNKLSSITFTNNISNLEPLKNKFESFSCSCDIVNGHDVHEIKNSIKKKMFKGKPHVIICNTIKGKGVPFAENQPIWHYKTLDEKLYLEAKKYLDK
jgi:transketolase